MKTALISVYDKAGVVDFARELQAIDYQIVSTGGTSALLAKNGIEHKEVGEITKFPERLEGRVKTLHPNIFMGILARREKQDHLDQLRDAGVNSIDLVVVNLYPFKETVSSPDVTLEEAVEQIDIGGVSLIRAAGKSFKDVITVTSPDNYAEVIELLKKNNGALPKEDAIRISSDVFALTSTYDAQISTYLNQIKDSEGELPVKINLSLSKEQAMRYGENPHQKAALYLDGSEALPYKQIHGKELSYNNLIDVDSALAIAYSYKQPAVSIIKHTNPSGVGIDENISLAFDKALATDPVSAFGGIIALNRSLDAATAEKINNMFVEVVAVPEFEDGALEILTKKKNIRILEIAKGFDPLSEFLEVKKIHGGFLVQEKDSLKFDISQFKVVTRREPTEEEWKALEFGWTMIRHVKSNAIVYCTSDRSIGVGTGQMSRIDSSEIAISKAKKHGLDVKGTVLISDAFFPFRDGVDAAAAAGATAVIEPGGSIRDDEIIEACNEHDMAMVFTGARHFKH